MPRDIRPRGKMEWVFLALVAVVLILTLRIALDPNASLSTREYIEIAEWVLKTLRGIFDSGGAI